MFHASQTSPAILRTSSTELTGAADMPFGYTRGDPTSAQNEALPHKRPGRHPQPGCRLFISTLSRHSRAIT